MSTRGLSLRALAERLRDPLWLPLVSALFAFLAFEAGGLFTGQSVLVATRNLPAGTVLRPSLVRRVRWEGPLPSPALAHPEGRLVVAIARGLPLLATTVTAGGATPPARTAEVGLPSGAVLSAPPLHLDEQVEVYVGESGLAPQRVVAQAKVSGLPSASGSIALEVSMAGLPALLAAVAAGHLIVVALPEE